MLAAKEKPGDLKSHQRVNTSLLGKYEKPALQSIAGHLPPWITPDQMTALGFIAAVLIAP